MNLINIFLTIIVDNIYIYIYFIATKPTKKYNKFSKNGERSNSLIKTTCELLVIQKHKFLINILDYKSI